MGGQEIEFLKACHSHACLPAGRKSGNLVVDPRLREDDTLISLIPLEVIY